MRVFIIRLHILLTFVCISFFATAQLINDGATVVIETGATLVVEGDLVNQSSGTITNSGTIEIQGDLDNTATITSSANSLVKFTGDSPASLTAGGAIFADVTVDKDAGQYLTLQDDLALTETLSFLTDDNRILCNSNILQIGATGDISGASPERYIVTDGGTSGLKKVGIAFGSSQMFPVGETTTDFNPIEITGETGHTTDNITVRSMTGLDGGLTGSAFTSGVTEFGWDIDEDVIGGSVLSMDAEWKTGASPAGHELPDFDTDNSGLSNHDGTSWDLSVDDVATIGSGTHTGYSSVTRSGISGLGAFIVGGAEVAAEVELNITAALQGAYVGPLMNDALRALATFPLVEPYTSLGYTHEGFGGGETTVVGNLDNVADGDDIVDWMVVEIRDATDPSIIKATQSGFIQRDGHIVDVEGDNNIKVKGISPGSYHVAIRHRNHLGTMGLNTFALSTTPTSIDFTSISTYGTNAQVDLGSGLMGMWGGDANGDGYVRASQTFIPPPGPGIVPSDRDEILNSGLSGIVTNQLTSYSIYDVNGDGYVRATQTFIPPPGPGVVPSDRDIVINTVLGGITTAQKEEQLPQ